MPRRMYRFFREESRRVRVPKDVLALLRQRFASVNRHRRVPQELRALPFVYAVSRSEDPHKPWQVCAVTRDGVELAWPRPIKFKALWNSGKHRPRPAPAAAGPDERAAPANPIAATVALTRPDQELDPFHATETH